MPGRSDRRLRLNDQIRAAMIRLVDESGEQVGLVPLEEGLRMAKEADKDLVEVAPDADPPVCRLLDYGKYKYRQKKRQHHKQHSSQIKEIRLHPKTGQHDIDYRLAHAQQFLEEGHRVLVTVFFKGREMVHIDIGREMLAKFAEPLAEVAKVEQMPKMEGRKMCLTLAPR